MDMKTPAVIIYRRGYECCGTRSEHLYTWFQSLSRKWERMSSSRVMIVVFGLPRRLASASRGLGYIKELGAPSEA